jgi:hypothetical protein
MLALGIPFCPVVFPDMLSYDCPEGGRYSEVGRLLHGFFVRGVCVWKDYSLLEARVVPGVAYPLTLCPAPVKL